VSHLFVGYDRFIFRLVWYDHARRSKQIDQL